MSRILVVADPNSPLTRARALAGLRGGHEVVWFAAAPPRAPLTGPSELIVPPLQGVPKVRGVVRALHLRRAVRRLRPDLIHVHWALQGLSTLELVRHRPLVVSIMGGDVLPDQMLRRARDRWLLRRLLNAADVITSKSEFLDRALARVGEFGHKVRRVTWGVDLEAFRPDLETHPLRRRLGIEADEVVFLCVRLCQPIYNKDLILEAFAECLRRGVHAKLLVSELFPDPDYQARLHRLATELDLDGHVRFLGAVPHEEMPTLYALADATVSFPSSDGMPQSLYEAMACGACPLLGDLPQYAELVSDGVNGRLAPVENVQALADRMSWVVEQRDRLEEIGALNRGKIAELADQAVQNRLVNGIYDELLGP